MLSDDDVERMGEEASEAMTAMEAAMLAAAASALASLGSLDARSSNRSAVALMAKLRAILAAHARAVDDAVSRDLTGAVLLDALTEAERIAGASAAASLAERGVDAADAVAAAQAEVRAMGQEMAESCRGVYLDAVAQARRDVARMGHARAMERAVSRMARQGLTAYTYKRRGPGGSMVTVRVPVDVGVRRAITNSGLQAMMREERAMAERHGLDLVEVNITPNARPSHADWQGRIYSLSGDHPDYPKFDEACRVGDLVNGIGGYNCKHRYAVTVEGAKQVFRDPLEGTGYTPDEARAAVSKQRRLENEIRKAKRLRETLKSQGLDTTDAERRVRARQKALRDHIAEHPKLLHRERPRERIYGKAMAKAAELGALNG